MTSWSMDEPLERRGSGPLPLTLRLWRSPPALAFALALGAWGLLLALEPPGQAIKDELVAAAADMGRLPWGAPPDSVKQAIEHSFPHRNVIVDPAGLPAYASVTLLHLSKAACLDAEVAARRVEGPVLVTLVAYGSPGECRDENDMTWRLMP